MLTLRYSADDRKGNSVRTWCYQGTTRSHAHTGLTDQTVDNLIWLSDDTRTRKQKSRKKKRKKYIFTKKTNLKKKKKKNKIKKSAPHPPLLFREDSRPPPSQWQ